MYTQVMQNLQSVTKGVLKRVEEVTGKSIQFMRDDNLAVLSTLPPPPPTPMTPSKEAA